MLDTIRTQLCVF